MTILGVNYIFHDSSACMIKGGEIAHAVEEERLIRQKHTQKFPFYSILECLELTETAPEEIEHVAVSVKPGCADGEKLAYAAGLGRDMGSFLTYEFERTKDRNLTFWKWFNATWPVGGGKRPTVHFVEHHAAHAIGTYFVSPWKSAALLSIDGWGEWSTTWLGHGRGRIVDRIGESYFPNSLGVFYSAATEFCGFKANYDEGKTMGLAPCGDPQRFFDLVDSMVSVNDEGEVLVDKSWFDFPSFTEKLCGPRIYEAFGSPRRPGEEFLQHHSDVAAAFQAVLEKAVLRLARLLKERTGERNLVYSGGVALNSVANGRIMEHGIFDDIFLVPGSGDSGTCIGAAAYVHSHVLGETKRLRHVSPYLGRSYNEQEIEATLINAKVSYQRPACIIEETADALSEGKIVGWFQGRMEFGPRALGARSILADPTRPGMKDKINAQVKHREAFRPFAPSVTKEAAKDYFSMEVAEPYMLKVSTVHPSMRGEIPAIVHVDGTARVQTVDREIAPEYHSLISAFGTRSGHPVVLNTSFNVMGEPIVGSPIDAIRCFYSTGLDILAIGPFLLRKS